MDMDMATRSFVLAAALALFAAAGLIGWSLFGGGLPGLSGSGGDTARTDRSGSITVREGSLFDEFGESERPARVVVNSDRVPVGSSRFGSGPRFDWSGSPSDPGVYDLPRETPAERVEADCRVRGGSSYGCRCLVRLSRADLSEAEFAFLSLAEEPTPRGDRLQASGLEARDLGALAAKLVALDAASRRRCGAGLAP